MPPPLSPDEWRRLEPLIDAVLDAPPERRPALLAELSDGEPGRFSELERLVAECERGLPLLSGPAATRFAALFEETHFPEALAERYELKGELGRGGMATVFLARDIRHDRDVAVKLVHRELTVSLGRERFLREIGIIARLHHPHIVPLFDSGEADGFLFYVMPYEEGRSLRERLASEGPLPVDDVMLILREVGDALAHAHAHGIVHRDIKPDNVLLSGRHVLVTDFGVAKAVTVASAEVNETSPGVAIGTPAYMAPEQIAGGPGVDHRADIYALGVLAYELLAGRPPFDGETRQDILAAHLTEKPRSLKSLRADVPPGLDRLVIQCLHKAPRDRPKDAEEFLNALEQALLSGAATEDVADIVADSDESQPAHTSSAASTGRAGAVATSGHWMRGSLGRAVVAIGALAAFGAVAWRQRGRAIDTPVEVSRPTLSVGILPVTAASPDGQLNRFVEGLENELSAELTGVSGLDVRPNETIAMAIALHLPLDSIASAHRVDYFVRATPSKGKTDSVVVTLELIEQGIRSVRAGELRLTLNEESFVDLVARQAGERLRPMLGSRVRERQLEAGSANAVAVQRRRRADNYRLIARTHLDTGNVAGAVAALDSADAFLVESARLDPDWAAPRLVRASMSAMRALLTLVQSEGRDQAGARRVFTRGIAIVDSVLKQQPRDPLALATRGRLRWQSLLMGELPLSDVVAATDSVERDLLAALAQDTTLAEAAAEMSQTMFAARARFDAAAAFAEIALRRDAYMEEASEIIDRLARSKLEIGRDAEAATWCAEGVRRFPANPAHFGCLLEVMAWGSGPAIPDSAGSLYREVESRIGSTNVSATATHMIALAAVLARAGVATHDSATAILRRVREEVASSPRASPAFRDLLPALEAAVLYRLGESRRADELFAQFDERYPDRAKQLRRSRMLAGFALSPPRSGGF